MDRASDSLMVLPKAIHFCWLEPELFVCCLVQRRSTAIGTASSNQDRIRKIGRGVPNGSTDDLPLIQISSLGLRLFIVLRLDLCVHRDDSLTS